MDTRQVRIKRRLEVLHLKIAVVHSEATGLGNTYKIARQASNIEFGENSFAH